MLPRILFAFLLFTPSCFRWLEYAECKVPQEEVTVKKITVDALKEITSTMGATYWEFDSDYCSVKMLRSTPDPPKESERKIVCDCSIENNTCHVVEILFKKVNLPGMLPPQLVKLPYLSKVDFAFNYLSGTIPKEWGSTNLTSISVFANHLSGEIPIELGRITTLTYLNLEANQFSGVVPHELGSLFKLELLVLSSNNFSGKLPVTLAKLQNMTEFRISDNNFSGEIPSFFIQNWKYLQRLDMLASGLEGPIPSNISLLSNLYQLRISDINGPSQDFPNLINMTRMKILILRNCHIIGVLPSYLWSMEKLEMLDVSFNKLVGKIPDARHAGYLRFLFLTHNMLSGNIPKSVLTDGSSVNLNLNLFRSFFGTKFVTENILEIRFYWAGKGTTRVPGGGAYGPLISALSIVSHSKPCSEQKSARRMIIVGVGFGVTALCLVIIIVGIFWWNGCFKGMIRAVKGTERQDSKMGTFTLEQIREATEDFSPVNKIGEGGFGPVYKGQLFDGTLVAVKQLSSKSRQGNHEFLNEIGLVSCLQHPNLVKLHGCCIEGNQLMLVYEYMENNSLAQALFSSKDQLNLDWPTRLRICIGIAKGLAFLHEESRLKIVHRDIKATNVLLDGNLNPKISDFGLARLDDEEKTHITTRIAGTIGYMAPEYALWGRLSYKADVYSYGVVVLEVVSGKSNNNYMPSDNRVCLLDKACHLQRTESLIELVDERLGSEIKPTEAIILMKVALLCTDVSPSHRPTMSEVVRMLEGRARIPDKIPQSSDFSEDIRFKSMRDIYQQRENHSLSSSQLDNSTGVLTLTSP
ncbi:probable LRR receptor-like serine/threonine-protein kinase RFK1 isoform X8 [Vigna angularis]|uniref:probable LRR receptor-like serine/threonine-protein kinase RFK1 isoform X8 n=1 Tax=Phaseolus angularis TaxID=3914 RepID=UPI0022B35268|nr:probable LRR receptor-like serine/threonine-protein kinase RFK1 isoform X8 [Vigna angularis]